MADAAKEGGINMNKSITLLHLIDWHWMLTAILGIYGAALTTYSISSARKQNRRQVKVTVNYGYLTYGRALGDEQMFILSASNPGQRAVTLTGVGFQLPDKRTLVLPYPQGTQLPHQLMEGTNCQHFVSIRDVARELSRSGFSQKVKLIGFYRDAVDVWHRSRPFPFNISEWA